MRLIDADKLTELCNIMADKCDGIGTSVWNQFRTTVEWSPSVDAVPVVRCRDCRYWDTSWEPSIFERDNPTYFCVINNMFPSGEWFCADGERKDDENET